MACNLMNPRFVDLKNSETLSEVSESGTGTTGGTWDSREDLRDFANLLGLRSPDDLCKDRFRVDRKKLQQMLLGDEEVAPETANSFFHKIMNETKTFITWPTRLKIDAKSKKDPVVRIAGLPNDVRVAKEKIMSVFYTKSNHITMKLDVSYTDHSHIIGKGGLCIKGVMEETQCHIHFPDSNRTNLHEKSNQVSIAGEISGVERARARIRNLTPLIFSFELPVLSSTQPTPDLNSPYVKNIEAQYNVQVMLRNRPKLHAHLIIVKGVEWEVQQVKEATMILMYQWCGSFARQTLIQVTLQISPQNHSFVLGQHSNNLKAIMQRTGTQIMFLDANDPNIPSIKKSQVTITGQIDNVFLARQQLIGSLPLVVMFDLPSLTAGLPIEQDNISKLMASLSVTINLRRKPKQNTQSVIIRGVERNATNIYEARNRILGVNNPTIVADIPSTYHTPINIPTVTAAPFIQHPLPPMSPLPTLVSPVWPYGNMPGFTFPTFSRVLPSPPPVVYNVMQGSLNSSGYHSSLGSIPNNSSSDQIKDGFYSSMNTVSSSHPSPCNTSPLCNVSSSDPSDLSSIVSDLSISEPVRNSGDNRSLTPVNHYEQKRMAAARAMQEKPTGNYRVATSTWAGYGVSQTSPAAIKFSQNKTESGSQESIWKNVTNQIEFSSESNDDLPSTSTTNLNTSNYVDHISPNVLKSITNSRWPDVPSMLMALGLEKYTRLFTSHEIDLGTFSLLTDKDLSEIGVSALGARRKMLLVISELNRRTNTYSGSAAPGAERKSFKSSTKNNKDTNDGW